MDCFKILGVISGILIIIILINVMINELKTKPIITEPKPVNTYQKEAFENPTKVPPKPSRVRIIYMNDTSFQVKFSYPKPMTPTDPVPNNFLIVLSKIDVDGNNVGEIKMLLSDENPDSTTQICNATGIEYNCSHTFTDLEKTDSAGKDYLYRIGVAVVIGDFISEFVEPNNIPIIAGQKLFTLAKDFKFSNLLSEDKTALSAASGSISGVSNVDFMGEGLDPQFKLLSDQLGGYPYNALLDTVSSKQNLLADLVDKSFEDAKLNVKVVV